MKSIAFFNNKGGVGKTTLSYNLSWMFGELGYSVVAADLDPQANLTAMFLDEDRLEELWPDGDHPQSILGSVSPTLCGLGDISEPHVEEVSDNLGLLVGDLGLSRFEARLSAAWPGCLDGDEAAFRIESAFYRTILRGAEIREADVVLIDVGPNLGAINRAAIIAANFVVFPLAPDLFSSGTVAAADDLNCLATLKHYRSLMPMAQEARKPIFHLKAADGALGGHIHAVKDCYRDYENLASAIALKCRIHA